MVRQGKQGTIVRIDDGRIAIHTKSTIYMAISLSEKLLTSAMYDFLFILHNPGAVSPARGQSDRVQHRDDPTKVRRTSLLAPAGEAHARGPGAWHRARGARAEDVRVARDGPGQCGAVRPRPSGGAQKVRGQHAAPRRRALERAAAARGGAGRAGGRSTTEARRGAGARRGSRGALFSCGRRRVGINTDRRRLVDSASARHS